MYPSQTNTQRGAYRVLAGELLTDMEGRFVTMTHDTGVAEVQLPETTDNPIGLLVDGNSDGGLVTVQPVNPEQQIRVVAKGTFNPGDQVVLADHSVAADKGKVRSLPVAAGTYRVIGIAEEKAVDGQLVLVRPCGPIDVTVS